MFSGMLPGWAALLTSERRWKPRRVRSLTHPTAKQEETDMETVTASVQYGDFKGEAKADN